jgi:SAM-dependent methyltransferase
MNHGCSRHFEPLVKLVEVIHAFLKRRGSTATMQRVWDIEYTSGKWDPTEDDTGSVRSRRDSALEVVERYSAGADILDLGCGLGATALEIADTYKSYVGVDVSNKAIERAALAMRLNPSRASKITYVVRDISTYVPPKPFSVILFRESIYYIPQHKTLATLRRFASFLSPNGVFIVRVHDRRKYRRLLKMIERNFRVVEWRLPDNGMTATVVFSLRA